MKTKVIVTLVVIAVIVTAIYFYMKNKKDKLNAVDLSAKPSTPTVNLPK